MKFGDTLVSLIVWAYLTKTQQGLEPILLWCLKWKLHPMESLFYFFPNYDGYKILQNLGVM